MAKVKTVFLPQKLTMSVPWVTVTVLEEKHGKSETPDGFWNKKTFHGEMENFIKLVDRFFFHKNSR